MQHDGFLATYPSDSSDFYTSDDTPDLEIADPALSALLREPPIPETFEEAVAMGLTEASHRSARTWRIGWLALNVPTEYGKRTLAVWSQQIRMSYSSVNKARWLAKGFPSRIVRKYPTLSVEHFTVVRSMLPKEVDPDDPKYGGIYAQVEELLREASVCEWSVDELADQVNPDRDKDGRGFSLAGEIGAEATDGGGIIGIYIEGDEAFRQWVEALSTSGKLGIFMQAIFKEDTRE